MVSFSNQPPGQRHTHALDLEFLRAFIANPDMEVSPMAIEHEHGTPPDDFRQHHTDVTHPNAGEREFEMGKDEAWFGNVKRTYDEYQQESLESIRRNRSYVDRVLSDSNSNNQAMEGVKLQALQNAVETANMLGKQAVTAYTHANERINAHRDIFADRVWNLDEVARIAAGVDPTNTALLGEMVKALAQTSPANLGMFVEALKTVAARKD